jgi:hypothetical protein
MRSLFTLFCSNIIFRTFIRVEMISNWLYWFSVFPFNLIRKFFLVWYKHWIIYKHLFISKILQFVSKYLLRCILTRRLIIILKCLINISLISFQLLKIRSLHIVNVIHNRLLGFYVTLKLSYYFVIIIHWFFLLILQSIIFNIFLTFGIIVIYIIGLFLSFEIYIFL